MYAQNEPGEDQPDFCNAVHRGVADDLQIITSLFDIRMAQVSDENTLCILRELQTLTKVMSIVHGTIYSTGTSESIIAQTLFEKIVKSVRLTHCTKTRIEATVEGGKSKVPADAAVPCAFVLAEIVRQSVLCSFEEITDGRIDVFFTGPGEDGWYTLRVTDNGFPEYATVREEEKDEAISMTVSEHIVRYRLKGTVTRSEEEGMAWTIRFPGDEVSHDKR